jgi:predicted transcriptional regulator
MKEVNGSSGELMLEILMNLGLTETEAYVYLYITKKGPQRARVIGEALSLYKQRLYRILKKCRGKASLRLRDIRLFFQQCRWRKS